jgi:hypothetical protein
MIEVEHDGRGRLWRAGDEVGPQRLGEPIEVLTLATGFKPRDGRRARQGRLGSQGRTLAPPLKQRSATEAVGIMAVGRAGGNVSDTLGQEVSQGMITVGGRPCSVDGGRSACGEANLAIDATEEEDTKVRGHGPTLEIGTDTLASKGMKRPLFWSRRDHGQTSSALYGIDRSHVLFYQRRGGSLPFFMKNPG